MQARRKNPFVTIRTEGSILPADLLQRIERGDRELKGLSPEDYHLPGSEKINEAVSRSWNRMLGAWTTFKTIIEKAPSGDTNTSATRERWLLPLFHEFGYGRLIAAKAVEIEGKPYPISHHWQHTPIHLVGSGVDLDTRTAGVAGAAKISPHSLAQEFLNRSSGSLWGFVSNGLQLRILRDNVSLTRQAFVEFDLEAMMNGEVYSDFVLLWLLCHESRVEATRPEECWLEKWSRAAQEQGTRALEQLRKGVEEAIKVLGSGFLKHRSNRALKDKLHSQQLSAQDYYRQILRLVYRLLFLFVAEDRELLLDPKADETARTRYKNFYSVARLRKLAERRVGTRHADLFAGLRLVMQKLGSDEGCAELGLPALGSFLFSSVAMPDIEECELMNVDLLAAIRALTFITDRHGRRLVDYKNLRSEELGSVYEALLELHPYFDTEAGAFELQTASGNERKTTGSYYTPESLVQCLLDSALDPVLDEATKKDNAEAAIRNLKVCDPACGSGHFLIAAAHRIAKRLAAIRTGDEEPAPDALRKALRDVIGDCIYGVDVNAMAVELCKVSLWMEALEPGKPLSFLEQHIQVGNSLLGTTPALLEKGIPDDAFKPIEGDDKAICAKFKKLNKEERLGVRRLPIGPWDRLGDLGTELARLEAIPDDDIAGVRQKEKRYENYIQSGNYPFTKFWADTWCAAFVWKKTESFDYPITEDVFRKIEHNPRDIQNWMRDEIIRLTDQYQFFHWHLAFPNVFGVPKSVEEAENQQAGWDRGFDVVLGNPPWERIKLQEKEWFASRRPDIANAPNAAARGRMIKALAVEDHALFKAFFEDRRKAEGESHLVRNSGRYPLCGRGDINTYAIFAETNRTILSKRGRVGCIVPSGIATDDTTKFFFADLMESRSLVSLYDFENATGLFPGVGHGRFKFCLLTLSGQPVESGADFVFFAHRVDDLREDDRHFTLTAEDLALLNPNTRTCPVFRRKHDAELTKAVYHRVPVLLQDETLENPWGVTFLRMLDMSNDSQLFRTREQLESEGWQLQGNIFRKDDESYLPLYEAKMLHHFDHRFGDYSDYPEGAQTTSLPDVPVSRLEDPNYVVQPRYWVNSEEVVFRTSRVPEGFVRFYKAKDEKTLGHILAVWLAGYYINHRDDKRANLLLQKAYGAPSTLYEATNEWLAAVGLEHSYPLTEKDLDVFKGLKNTSGTLLEMARELIEARCPKWLIGFRDITNTTNERTAIFGVLPLAGVGNNAPLAILSPNRPGLEPLFAGSLSSFVFDFFTRFSVGGTHLNFFVVKQLPVLPPQAYEQQAAWTSEHLRDWLLPRVLELTYTAFDLKGFAEDCGYDGEPFVWDEDRRFLLRCELDAAYFHLYGIEREDVDYILETFPIVKRKDEQAHGEYRTKRVILEIYDAMQRAIETGEPYQTRLDPPPANGWTPPAIEVETDNAESQSEATDQTEAFRLRSEALNPQPRLDFEEKA